MKTIPLTRGLVALVDDEDFDRVSAFTWYATSHGYVQRCFNIDGKKMHVYLHRFLLDPPSGLVCDHINRDKLDNRRANLRIVDQRANMWNQSKQKGKTSQYRGVYRSTSGAGWTVQMRAEGKTRTVGRFASEVEAAQAYDRFAVEFRGELAVLNFGIADEPKRLMPAFCGRHSEP